MKTDAVAKPLVFVVDDDERLGALLTEYLERYGFVARSFSDSAEALALLSDRSRPPPALVVSDVMMPGLDGLALLKQVRAFSRVPFLLLTARGEVPDRVLGLELGADDYLSKPFEPRELVARIQSVLRRTGETWDPKSAAGKSARPDSVLCFEGLRVDLAAQRVWLDDWEVEFTSTEFEVLSKLVARAGTVVTRDTLMEEVRGIEWESDNRSIDVMVSKLRAKLGCDPQAPRFIRTIRGSGYLFRATPVAPASVSPGTS